MATQSADSPTPVAIERPILTEGLPKETTSTVVSSKTETTRSEKLVVKESPLATAKGVWDWIDDRDIDKHVVSLAILYGTHIIVNWAMYFASLHPEKSGTEIAAIIAAVSMPYMALQAAALKYYFEARPTTR